MKLDKVLAGIFDKKSTRNESVKGLFVASGNTNVHFTGCRPWQWRQWITSVFDSMKNHIFCISHVIKILERPCPWRNALFLDHQSLFRKIPEPIWVDCWLGARELGFARGRKFVNLNQLHLSALPKLESLLQMVQANVVKRSVHFRRHRLSL